MELTKLEEYEEQIRNILKTEPTLPVEFSIKVLEENKEARTALISQSVKYRHSETRGYQFEKEENYIRVKELNKENYLKKMFIKNLKELKKIIEIQIDRLEKFDFSDKKVGFISRPLKID